MKKLIIKKDQWSRGLNKEDPDTCLLNKKGKMCCLGFLARQVFGFKKSQILEIDQLKYLEFVPPKNRELFQQFLKTKSPPFTSSVEDQFVNINDSEMNDGNRQRKLKKMFKEMGIDVEFV